MSQTLGKLETTSGLGFLSGGGERSVQFSPLPAEGNTHKPRQKGVEAQGSEVAPREMRGGTEEACSLGTGLGQNEWKISRTTNWGGNL